jgi:hypothetical protein
MIRRVAPLSTLYVVHPRQRRSAWTIARLLPLALAAVFFVVSAPAAHADAPPIATIGLTPGWITFGQAVPQGAAHGGLKIGGLETQTDVKTTWPDGSIRFAVLTANVPAAGSYAVTGALASAGAPLTPSLPAASATFTIEGVVYTATLPSALSADRWLSGPLAYEGRSIVAPVSSADGSPHSFLRVIFDTRAYADGNGRVDVTVENVLDQADASTVKYDVTIAVNGVPAFSKAGVEHFYLTRWRKVFDVGTGARAAIAPDMTPFNVSRALPPYLPLVGTQVDLMPADGSYDILRSGTLDPNMPAHGGNPDLAPFPDWAARYLVTKSPLSARSCWPTAIWRVRGPCTCVNRRARTTAASVLGDCCLSISGPLCGTTSGARGISWRTARRWITSRARRCQSANTAVRILVLGSRRSFPTTRTSLPSPMSRTS